MSTTEFNIGYETVISQRVFKFQNVPEEIFRYTESVREFFKDNSAIHLLKRIAQTILSSKAINSEEFLTIHIVQNYKSATLSISDGGKEENSGVPKMLYQSEVNHVSLPTHIKLYYENNTLSFPSER